METTELPDKETCCILDQKAQHPFNSGLPKNRPSCDSIYGTSRIGTSIETERLVVIEGWREGAERGMTANGHRVLLG